MTRILVFFFAASFSLIVGHSSYGQQSSVPDLLNAGEEGFDSDTARIDFLNQQALKNQFVSLLNAFSYGRQALELSVKTGYAYGEAYAYRNLGSSYAIRQDFVTALQLLDKASIIFEKIGIEQGIADCYISIGHVYRWQLNYAQANVYQFKAAKIYDSLHIRHRYAVCLHNIGENYLLLGELEEAKKVINQAISIFELDDNRQVITSCYRVLGQISFKEDDLELAEKYYKRALSISEELGKDAQKEDTFEAFIALAKIYHQWNRADSEEAMIKQSLAVATDNELFIQQREGYQQLIKFYFSAQKYEEASATFEAYNMLNEKLLTQQKMEMANMMEQVLQTIRLANENEGLRAEGAMQEERIRFQKAQLYVSLAFIGFFVGIVFVMVRLIRQKKKFNTELARKNKLIEEKSDYLEELIAVKDKFFSIISHDLRSPLGTLSQFVSLLKVSRKEFSEQELDNVLEKFDNQLNSTLALTDDIILWAKSEINENQDGKGVFTINKAVESALRVTSEPLSMKGISLDFKSEVVLQVVGNQDQIEFCIRNVVSNAVKFTESRGKISITVFEENGMAGVKVADTGRGMSEQTIGKLFGSPMKQNQAELGTAGERGKGLGLYLVSDFMKKNGGKVQVTSKEGSGSTFILYLPIAPKA